MRHDEFAFFNEQLARMLDDGVPLEGAIRELCTHMRKGRLRRQLEALRHDLEAGRPLSESARRHGLPALYVQALTAGERSGQLPMMVDQMGNYYRRAGLIRTRLQGLLVYPAIVLGLSLLFTLVYTFHLGPQMQQEVALLTDADTRGMAATVYVAPVLILGICLLLVLAWCCRPLRNWLAWRVPAFKEAQYAQLAGQLQAMIAGGVPLTEAFDLAHALNRGSRVGRTLRSLRDNVQAGQADIGKMLADSKQIPPLFAWLVSIHPADPATGFARAAALHQESSDHRAEVLLYVVMPVCVVLLAMVVALQVHGILQPVMALMNELGFF